MSNILRGLFDFRSKEEKARSYEAYSKRIFPYGDEQREKVTELLVALFPDLKRQYLSMYYILIKEGMTEKEQKDFEAAEKKAAKYRLLPKKPELKAAVKVLLDIDFAIDENLEYPTVEELRDAISGHSYL